MPYFVIRQWVRFTDWLLEHNQKWWARLVLGSTRKAWNAKWWIYHRFHPRHRYNIVDTGLPPGYHDADTRIEAVIMREFCRWYEAKYHPESHPERMTAIYQAIKGTSPYDWSPSGLNPSYEELTEYLVEIVKFRRRLWY